MARSTRQAVATDRLDDMLTRLKLPGLRDQLDTLLDEATRHDLSMRETLALLCEREIARKDQRRIEMGLKVAHFPYVRELTSFDFAAQPSVDAKQVRDLAAARWVANGENVLLLGPPGVGKTHLAIALGRCGHNRWPFGSVRDRHRARRQPGEGARTGTSRGAINHLYQT